MKKITTLLAILILTTAFGQLTFVPDDNFEQALIDLGYDSPPLDNYVLTADISGVTSLDVSNLNIADLTGIEDFAALITLKCGNNQLTSIDVTQNTALEDLRCANNQLVSLNVSYNSSLFFLWCFNNQLSYLDVKNGNNSNFTSFNATGNPSLNCIEVDNAVYSNIFWTNIDPQSFFSTNCGITYVPDDNFEQALIDLGYDSGALDDFVPTANIDTITILDITYEFIYYLTGIEDFTALTDLDCSNNLLTTIDISQNSALTDLSCNDNQISSIDVSQNAALTILSINDNQLTSIDISQNAALTILSINNNQLTSIDISQNNVLTTLICNSNLLTSIDVSQNSNLDYLSISDNQLTNIDVSQNNALDFLWAQNNLLLTSLNIKNGNNINITNIRFNVTSTPNLTCIEVDDIVYSINNWLNIDPQHFFSINCSSPAQTYIPDDNFEQALINLGYDTVLDDYVITSTIDTIISLNISSNSIADLTGIAGFTALESLNCSQNLLTSLDLSQNSALSSLLCTNNQLTIIDVSQNTNLITLNCAGNTLTDLNVKNGNNINFVTFDATSNPNLTCIEVDDPAYSMANWTNIDTQSFFSLSCGAVTYVPDDNFEQALINLGYDNVLDDYVLTSNINTISILSVANKNITDLTGIEDFTILSGLDCSNNLLTTLDVSQNVYLGILNCSNNLLTSLDVSQFVDLTLLNCANNQLTYIDVSQNPDLNLLYCEQNQLTTLDVSSNTMLEYLKCQDNQLTSLNVKNTNNINFITFSATNNPNLTCIQVDDTTWSNANWTSIDPQSYFSESCVQYTYVPDDNFEQALIDLGYDSGQLDDYVLTANISGVTTLNVSNKNITDLTGVEDFMALTDLNCFNNQLTSLDVSSNTALTDLNFGFNQVTSIDVSNNTALTSLSCFGNLLTSLDVSQNLSLEILGCWDNQLTNIDVSNNSALTELYCENNQLTNLDVSSNSSLTVLWCTTNMITNIDLSNNTLLTVLGCQENQLSSIDVSNNTALTELSCGANQLINLDVSQNTALTLLTCNSNLLESLNVKNGNNTIITSFSATNNPNLFCIEVDNVTWSNANWTNIDPQSFFSENCTQLTFVPDDNFENYLENNGMGNGIPNDDSVLTANINGVANLNVSSLNIADLTGIEDFTALQNLNVTDNVLTDLDLTQNQNLQNLLCQNNSIELLNLSQNPNLVNLRCQNNQLTGLNVQNGNNVSITNGNFIANNNPNLSCIFVDDASWSAANWTNIDPTSIFVNNQVECDALSVEDVSFSNSVKVHPNPTTSVFKITTDYALTKIELFNSLGEKVSAFIPQEDYNIEQLTDGLYFIKIYAEGRIALKKLIIR